ncbi:MAG: PepSY-like domain-containing protein [Bacteroidota bacterium]|nr:PepSY-like domain-containing protein [Bacteroidota bacterium]MDQ6904027.1 PepSY-like domain-containing protein [Bacteroidota bacterium]
MKTLMMLVFAGGITLSACAQKMDASKVPSAIKTSFAKDYPGISPKWEKEVPNYEANFKMNGKTMSALYDAKGARQESETDIKVADLPASVKDYIAQNYKGEKIKEAAIITKANGEVNYEAEVKGMDVLFTKEGKFIKTAKD